MIQQSKCLDIFDTNLKAKHSTMQNDIAGIGDDFDTNLKANHNDNTRSAWTYELLKIPIKNKHNKYKEKSHETKRTSYVKNGN